MLSFSTKQATYSKNVFTVEASDIGFMGDERSVEIVSHVTGVKKKFVFKSKKGTFEDLLGWFFVCEDNPDLKLVILND